MGILAACLAMAGCGGISEGGRYHVSSGWLYFHKEDAEGGGGPGRHIDLVADRRAELLQDSDVVVISLDGYLSKIKVAKGRHQDSTGWVENKDMQSR